MKKGFLTSNSKSDRVTSKSSNTIKKTKRPPMMFKIDFTIDTSNNFRIYELGHPFSNNAGGLEDSIYNLIKKLNLYYDHVYISGDYSEAWNYRAEFIQKGEQPPRYVPIDELIGIRTENSIVIIRTTESPTYYTPYCIQQELRKTGSHLSVFGAEPLACINAYEKIIMQRLQIQTKITYPIPSALVNILPGQDVVSQFQSQMTQQSSPFWRNDIQYIIKPAFSSCGWGVQYAGTASEVIKLLQQLQSKYVIRTTCYQRTAEDFIGMLFIGDNKITDLQQRKEKVLEFVERNYLYCLAHDFDMRPNPDPFFIVQQLVFTPCVMHEGQRWMPTYRTFILIQDDNDSVKVSLLEKIVCFYPKKPLCPTEMDTDSIVAGISTSRLRSNLNESAVNSVLQSLNSEENKSFFNAIFRNEATFISNTLLGAFPELRLYWKAIIHYPPYQKILNQNQENNQIRRYEDLVMIYKIQRLLEVSSMSGYYLPYLAQLVDMYRKVSSENPENHAYLDFFSKTAQKFFIKLDVCTLDLSPENQSDYLKILLGMLIINIHLMQYTTQNISLKLIKSYLEKIIETIFNVYPRASDLYSRELENSEDQLFKEFMQEKNSRDTVVEYTSSLCTLEKTLKEKCLPIAEVESILHEQKSRFLCWSMFYFQNVSTSSAPILREISQLS